MADTRAIDRNDIASGRFSRLFSGAFDILDEDPGKAAYGARVCRAIVAQGAVTYTGTDDVNVALPDLGDWQWDVQAKAIVSGAGVVIW